MAARRDKDLEKAVKSAKLIIPESTGIAMILRLKGIKIPIVPGIEIAFKLLSYAEEKKWKVY